MARLTRPALFMLLWFAVAKCQYPCHGDVCGAGSTCQSGFNQTFTCLCLGGQRYDESAKRCAEAKVFPGHLSLTKVKWDEDLKDKASQLFQDISEKIISELKKSFKDDETYIQTIVVEFKENTSKMRNLGTSATLENIFSLSSKATDEDVDKTIQQAIDTSTSTGLLSGAQFEKSDICSISTTCDVKTTTCSSNNGLFKCSCKEEYALSQFSIRACIACPSGQWADSNKCTPCSFGHSGFNCDESWQLTLVIVGSVLGGLLLLMVIVVGVLSHRKSKKVLDAVEETPYYSHPLAKAPLINPKDTMLDTANNGFPKIPRATPARDPLGGTHLEMTPNNGRLNAVPRASSAARPYNNPAQNRATTNPYTQNRDPYEQNRATTNPYNQNRNPYEQNRATTNPYNQKQGYTNSHYMNDDQY